MHTYIIHTHAHKYTHAYVHTYRHTDIHAYKYTQALDAAARIRAEQTFLVGMTCSMGMHDDVDKELSEWSDRHGIRVCLAHDGMMLEFDHWSKSRAQLAGISGAGKIGN